MAMLKIKQLIDRVTGKNIYPITTTKAVKDTATKKSLFQLLSNIPMYDDEEEPAVMSVRRDADTLAGIEASAFALKEEYNGIICVLLNDGWVYEEASGTYLYTIPIPALTGDELFDVNLYDDGTASQDQIDTFNELVSRIDVNAGEVVVQSLDKPEVTFSVILRGMCNIEDVVVANLSDVIEKYDQINEDVEHLKNYVTPQMYGAKGDGVTDDTTAFQNALNKILELGGGTLYIPKGNYYITPLTPVPCNIIITGSGESSILVCNGSIFDFAQNDSVKLFHYHFNNLQFRQNTEDGYSIDAKYTMQTANQTFGIRVDNCKFTSTTTKIGGAIRLVHYADFYITNSLFVETNDGIYINNVVNAFIIGCNFTGVVKPLHVQGDEGSETSTCGIMVDSCKFIANDNAPILEHADYVTLNHCMIDYNNSPLKLLKNVSATVKGCYIGASVTPVMEVSGILHNIIEGNRITNYLNDGISMLVSSPSVIADNFFQQGKTHIHVKSTNVNISSNYFQTSKSDAVAILNDTEIYDLIIANNHFQLIGSNSESLTLHSNTTAFIDNNVGATKLTNSLPTVILANGYNYGRFSHGKVVRPKSIICMTDGFYVSNWDSTYYTVKTRSGQDLTSDTAVRVSIIV